MLTLVVAAASLFAQGNGLLGSLITPQDGQSRRESSTNRIGADGKRSQFGKPRFDLTEASNSDNYRVAPGATHVLMDAKGPGVITHMWFTFLGPEKQDWAPNGSADHQDMLIRIYWDGNPKPAVEAPLGDFFANSFGKRSEVHSLPVIVEDADSYNCFWQMPFRKSAKVEIVNQGTKNVNLLYYNIDWVKKKSLPANTPYFYAQYRQEYPVQTGKDYVVLETQGKGHYVGTVMSVRTRSPSWFGEGDEKIYIDGESDASIWGTGTEDYFLSAWGLKTTSTPYFGVPYFDQWGIVGGHTSAYRWHIADPIVFEKGIKVAFEHWGWISPDENKDYKSMSWNEREDDFSSVAFWYQTGTPTFTARAPSGADRKLPSLERVLVSAKDFSDAKYHGPGSATAQDLSVHELPQLLYMPKTQEGAFIEIPFSVAEKEPLRLLLNVTKSYDFGTYQAYLDGVKLGGPIDLYNKDIKAEEVHLLDFWPEPGEHKIKLVCTGKNKNSDGFYLGLESIRLRERRPRVKQMGHEKEKDWKTNPSLHG